MSGSDGADDAHGLVDGERHTWPFPPERSERVSLDVELPADVFHLTRRRSAVAGDVLGVDTRRNVVIHNAFWVSGKVPSLNELLDSKSRAPVSMRSIIMRRKPVKGQGRWCEYNEIKQNWKARTVRALGTPFVRVERCYFTYLVVEESMKRDPSNICSAAIKFIEDGLVEAGVIPNDGWKNVLGIRMHAIHRKDREPGVYVIMSDERIDEERAEREYEEAFQHQCLTQ